VRKQYRVEVEGRPCAVGEGARIDAPLDGKPSATEFVVVEYDAARGHSVLAVELITGRKHQIRRHLAGIGCPVVGDYRYGAKRGGELLALRAVSLQFTCPLRRSEKSYSVGALAAPLA
jgi:tRNA pseudouridine32 synthase/23S rRNA pseudouridine746 synthase